MALEFKLPDLGEGIHEGEVLAVRVSVGDAVVEGDTILEVETDKAAVEIPSPVTGTVVEIRVKPGELVEVGAVMMVFDAVGAKPVPASRPEADSKPSPVRVAAPEPARAAAPEPGGKRSGPVPAAPATRRLARELGVDLTRVTPTGPAGLVTAADVRAVAEGAPQAAPASAPAPGTPQAPAEPSPAAFAPRPLVVDVPPLPDFEKWGPVERVPLRSIRRAIARQMSLAWQQIPHVTSHADVDITKLEAFRERRKAPVEAAGGRLSLTVFVLKAAAAALKAFPDFNASLDTATGEIIRKRYCHIGVAVDTGEGLVVPVLRDVDRKSIDELSRELPELVDRSRRRKVSREEMQGGTFTLTNIGAIGGGHFFPIINNPEVAILGMGRAPLQPVVRPAGGNRHEIVARFILPMVLTVDHRVLDGADAARFMQMVSRALEDPEELLMTM